MKRVVWNSNPELDSAELDSIRAEMAEQNGVLEETLSNSEVLEYFLEVLNPMYRRDEESQLDIVLPGKVIAIADLGLWHGRRNGYRILDNDLSCVLQSHVNGMSEICIYGDSYNIRADEVHHDGTNHYLYRMLCPDKDAAPLLEAIYYGKEVSKSLLNRYTRSLYPYVAKIYGWPCRSKQQGVQK